MTQYYRAPELLTGATHYTQAGRSRSLVEGLAGICRCWIGLAVLSEDSLQTNPFMLLFFRHWQVFFPSGRNMLYIRSAETILSYIVYNLKVG